MNTNYIPHSNEELLHWLKNFTSQLPAIGTTLGVTPAESAALSALIYDVKLDLQTNKIVDMESKKKAMLVFLQKLIKNMKAHPAYSDEKYGKLLNII